MKSVSLFLLIGILGLSFVDEKIEIKQCTERKGKILLIHYYTNVENKVLKDYKKHNKRYRYIHGLPCDGPMYDGKNKILDIYGLYNISDSSKVMFYGDCFEKDILLPFRYSEIGLDSLINDSILGFTLKNKKQILLSNTQFTDTIVSIVKEGKRVIKRTTIYYVKNYGLVNRKNIVDYQERTNRTNEENRIQDSIEIDELRKIDEKK